MENWLNYGFDCPYCGHYIEEAEYWRYGVGDKIKCPNCGNICIKDIEDACDEDGNDIGWYYLRKPILPDEKEP